MKRLSLLLLLSATAADAASPCRSRNRSYAYAVGHGHVAIAGGATLDDLQRVREGLGDDFLWVRLEKRSYVIHDSDVLNRVRLLFAPARALAPEVESVEREEAALDSQIDSFDDVPRMAAIDEQIERLRAKLDEVQRRERALDRRVDQLSCEAEMRMWPLVEQAIRKGLAQRLR